MIERNLVRDPVFQRHIRNPRQEDRRASPLQARADADGPELVGVSNGYLTCLSLTQSCGHAYSYCQDTICVGAPPARLSEREAAAPYRSGFQAFPALPRLAHPGRSPLRMTMAQGAA